MEDIINNLDAINEKLKVLDILTKVCQDKDGYVNPFFAGKALYIDASANITDEERTLILNYFKKHNINYDNDSSQWVI